MNRNTFKWRIFKYNIIVIGGLIVLATIIFNVSVQVYIKKDVLSQLTNIAQQAEETALRQGPEFFRDNRMGPPPPPGNSGALQNYGGNGAGGTSRDGEGALTGSTTADGGKTGTAASSGNPEDDILIKFYFKLDRSLRETLSVLNADFLLLDNNGNTITPNDDNFYTVSGELVNALSSEFFKQKEPGQETYLSFKYSGMDYVAIVKSVSDKNNFGLGWMIIYSNLQKVNQLQWGINTILLVILVLSALIVAFFSSLAARKISEPFSSLNRHIGSIAERNFGEKIRMPVYGELQELVNNINGMSEKLETYDKAQKTFLQNASHEFRTPLMSIQSYAEGIKYEVVDNQSAADIIIDEAKRMTHLVEDLLYLSRLEAIEESYRFATLSLNDLLNGCVERMNAIAEKSGITLALKLPEENLEISADEEKLSKAVTNIVSNCIRYAAGSVWIEVQVLEDRRLRISISDDGPGFDPDEIPKLFERFYKGKKGNFGLGLAIAKNVIDRHKGTVEASNTATGALFTLELPSMNTSWREREKYS